MHENSIVFKFLKFGETSFNHNVSIILYLEKQVLSFSLDIRIECL